MDIVEIPVLKDGKKEIVRFTNDESIFRCNEDQKYQRLESDEQILNPKGKGRGIMVSMILCVCHGEMKDPENEECARVILKYGKNYDGYWDGKDVSEMFIRKFSNSILDFIPLYMFDNSSNHLKKAEDCRNDKAIYLNLSDGGKNKKSHPPYASDVEVIV